MRLSPEQKVGLFFLGGIVLFVAFIEVTVGTGLLARGYPLEATFRDVQGLSEGAGVRVAGVRAGTVDEVRLTPDGVDVRLHIDEDVRLRRDAVARLDFQALSGTRFVAIDPGRAGSVLSPGDSILTEEPVGISEMVDELQGVARSIRVLADSLNENQERFLTNVNAMLEENRQAFGETLQNLESVTAKLDSGEGTLGKLLSDSTIHDEAAATLAELRASFGDVRRLIEPLARGESTLARLIHEEELYDDLRETVASLQVTAGNVEEISDQIVRGEGTLGRLLADETLYEETEQAVRGLNRTTEGIEDQAPISILGTLLGVLF